jgi:hypothetical protein
MNPPIAAEARLVDAPVEPNTPSVQAVVSATASSADVADQARAVFMAAQHLLPHLERGQRLDASVSRAAMTQAFGASDASGAWDWKLAYEATEAATVLFLRRYGPALIGKARSPRGMLPLLGRLTALTPTQTRRSEESSAFQQFSTPIELGWAVVTAAGIRPGDLVLEPSAGTGLLAILAELKASKLALNELAPNRAGLLAKLFPLTSVTQCDAAQIDDHLEPTMRPSVIVMNPPFSAMAHVAGRAPDAAWRHVRSALSRLEPGGRLVAITGVGSQPRSRPGARRSCGFRSRPASSSPQPSTGPSSPTTVRPSKPA